MTKVHNVIEEESTLVSNILYKRVLQSYDAIVIVTFKVLSDHVMFWKQYRYFPSHELKSVAHEIEVFKPS